MVVLSDLVRPHQSRGATSDIHRPIITLGSRVTHHYQSMQSLDTLLHHVVDVSVTMTIGILLPLAPSGFLMAQQAPLPVSDPPNSIPSASNLASTPNRASPTISPVSPSTNPAESSLFYFLNMSGRNQAAFKPLTSAQRVSFYAKGLFGPFMFLSAATSAGVTQAMDVPSAWGQGAEGYGHRFGNYFAKQAVQRSLRLGGEQLLHEDNRYFESGKQGVKRRILYALKSSVMARSNDGTQHISISEIGSIAGASFISRSWQPSTNNSPGDGAVSFGIGMGVNAGTNILREFLPDLTHRLFKTNQPNK